MTTITEVLQRISAITRTVRGASGDLSGRARATTVICGIPVGRMEDLAG